jgi:signal transduction histidine kinase
MLPASRNRDTLLKRKSINYLEMAIQEIRHLSGELVRNEQNNIELITQVQTIIDDTREVSPIQISFIHSGDIQSLQQDYQKTVLRIIQEQLNNIIKYSKATKVKIGLELCNHELMLVIKDNGLGFNQALKRKGIGLSNIFDLAQEHKGYADLQTEIGKGCSLLVILPV